MHGYPKFSFSIPIAVTEVYFPCIVTNDIKNPPSVSEGTVLCLKRVDTFGDQILQMIIVPGKFLSLSLSSSALCELLYFFSRVFLSFFFL